jgi:hypothetical protein
MIRRLPPRGPWLLVRRQTSSRIESKHSRLYLLRTDTRECPFFVMPSLRCKSSNSESTLPQSLKHVRTGIFRNGLKTEGIAHIYSPKAYSAVLFTSFRMLG